MKDCGVGGTNQGLVTTYKTFTSQSIQCKYNRFTFKEHDKVCYNTHKNRLVTTILADVYH